MNKIRFLELFYDIQHFCYNDAQSLLIGKLQSNSRDFPYA